MTSKELFTVEKLKNSVLWKSKSMNFETPFGFETISVFNLLSKKSQNELLKIGKTKCFLDIKTVKLFKI